MREDKLFMIESIYSTNDHQEKKNQADNEIKGNNHDPSGKSAFYKFPIF